VEDSFNVIFVKAVDEIFGAAPADAFSDILPLMDLPFCLDDLLIEELITELPEEDIDRLESLNALRSCFELIMLILDAVKGISKDTLVIL
jgi:hypothetical protein